MASNEEGVSKFLKRLLDRRPALDVAQSLAAQTRRALAEVCGALVLAGEISLTGAIGANEFAQAHQRLARGRAPGNADHG